MITRNNILIGLIKCFFFFGIAYIFVHQFVLKDNPAVIRQKEYSDTINGLEGRKAKYVVFGDSHAAFIVQELWGEEFYNMAFGSDSIREMYIKLLYVVENHPHIKTILITADWHIFSEHRADTNNKDYIKPFVSREIYENLYKENYGNDLLSSQLSRVPVFNNNVYVFARRALMSKIGRLIMGKPIKADTHKSRWDEMTSTAKEEEARERAQTHLAYIKDKEFVFWYKELIKLCRENNLRVIGIRYPLTKEYQDAMKKYDLIKIENIYNSVVFDAILDYSDSIKDPKYFVNSDHLNGDGAIYFLERLYQDIDDLN